MKKSTKLRIQFLVLAIFSYVLASYVMPQYIPTEPVDMYSREWLGLIIATILIFIVVPIYNWRWVIKGGEQAPWKIIITLSVSCLVARYQYPVEISQHFEFITWLRYPIIGVVLIIEFYLISTIVKSLWQARSLVGDPRVKILAKYEDDDKALAMGIALAHEPASWYYAIPWFSRSHVSAVANLKLMSATLWHISLVLSGLLGIAVLSYYMLVDWSEITAVLVACFIFYSSIMLVANYRVSKYYSIYFQGDQLIINNAWWGYMVINTAEISSCELESDIGKENTRLSKFGRGDPNMVINFSKPQKYYTAMGYIVDELDCIKLSVKKTENLIDRLNSH